MEDIESSRTFRFQQILFTQDIMNPNEIEIATKRQNEIGIIVQTVPEIRLVLISLAQTGQNMVRNHGYNVIVRGFGLPPMRNPGGAIPFPINIKPQTSSRWETVSAKEMILYLILIEAYLLGSTFAVPSAMSQRDQMVQSTKFSRLTYSSPSMFNPISLKTTKIAREGLMRDTMSLSGPMPGIAGPTLTNIITRS